MANDMEPLPEQRARFMAQTSYAALFPDEDPRLAKLIDVGMDYRIAKAMIEVTDQRAAASNEDPNSAWDYPHEPLCADCEPYRIALSILAAAFVFGGCILCWI